MKLTRRNLIKSIAILGAGYSVPLMASSNLDKDYAWIMFHGPDGRLIGRLSAGRKFGFKGDAQASSEIFMENLFMTDGGCHLRASPYMIFASYSDEENEFLSGLFSMDFDNTGQLFLIGAELDDSAQEFVDLVHNWSAWGKYIENQVLNGTGRKGEKPVGLLS